jgi:hypothetical protein
MQSLPTGSLLGRQRYVVIRKEKFLRGWGTNEHQPQKGNICSALAAGALRPLASDTQTVMIFSSNLACLLLALTAASSLNFAAAGDPPSLRARTSGPVALKQHPDHPKPLQLVAQLASLDSR